MSLIMGTLFQYITFDYLWWVLLLYCLLRLLKTDNPRWWLGIGLFIGLGMLTKYTMSFLVISLVATVLITPLRQHLRSPRLWAGALLSFFIFLPNLFWQIQHDFISLEWVLWTACVRAGCRRGLAAVVAAALVIPLAVLGALPSLDHYRGLSGLDSALMGALVATGLRSGATRTSLVSAALFAAKLGYELFTARTFFLDSGADGFVPVPLAHLLGAVCGCLAVGWSTPARGEVRGPALGARALRSGRST
jgi:4-amino-4-deoxy-L-arabinose transferase-like glycosyltransferase